MPNKLERNAHSTGSADTLARARAAVAAVVDPEIPILTLEDLGILRGVAHKDDGDESEVGEQTWVGHS